MTWRRLHDLLKGLRSNLKFSNWVELIYDRLARRRIRLARYIWKNNFVFLCNSNLRDHISIQECFCERVYDFLLDQCSFPSNRIAYVNVGANIGAFDVLLLERGLTIDTGLAVELNPHTAARCVVNFQSNGIDTTHIVNAGVAAGNGRIKFNQTGTSVSGNIFFEPADPTEGAQVDLVTLETLLERHASHFPRFDLLKLDCERAEYGIIDTASTVLLRKFRYIIVEFHPPLENQSVEAAYAKFKSAGFSPLRNQWNKFEFLELFSRQ
jgi:FkbM family methyltransferase